MSKNLLLGVVAATSMITSEQLTAQTIFFENFGFNQNRIETKYKPAEGMSFADTAGLKLITSAPTEEQTDQYHIENGYYAITPIKNIGLSMVDIINTWTTINPNWENGHNYTVWTGLHLNITILGY